MQPEILEPEVIEQVPVQEPPGKSRMKQLHDTLVKEKYDVPEDAQVFEEKLLEDPERLRQLYTQLTKDKFGDLPSDYDTFEQKLTEGLKKKDLLDPSQGIGGRASSTGLATGLPVSPAGGIAAPSPNPLATPTAPPATGIASTEALPQQFESPLAGAGARTFPPEFTGPVPEGTYVKPTDAGTAAEGTQYVDAPASAAAAAPEAADVADDGFWASLGKSLYNGLDPKRIGGNLLDYGGDMLELLGRTHSLGAGSGAGMSTADVVPTPAELSAPLRGDKLSDAQAAELLRAAQAGDLPLSAAAQQSLLSKPSLAAAGNLLGSGVASIVPVAAATALGGPAAGVGVGAGLGISATKETARAAGINDKEAAAMATVLAPIQGALEFLGVKDPGIAKLAVRATLREAIAAGGGKLTAAALTTAAKTVLPEIGRRAAAGAGHEALTEFLQGEAEGGAKLIADKLRGNADAPAGQGRYGVSAVDALVKSPIEQALVGGLLGGAMGTLHGGPAAAEPASAGTDVPRGTYPPEGETYSATVNDGKTAILGARVAGHYLSKQGVETYQLVTPDGTAHEVPVADARPEAAPEQMPVVADVADTNVGNMPATPEPVAEAEPTEAAPLPEGAPSPFPAERSAALERLERARTRLAEAKAEAAKKPKIVMSTLVPLPTVDADVVKAYLELAGAHINNGVVSVKELVAKLRTDAKDEAALSQSEPEREQQLTSLARHALAQAGEKTDLPTFDANKPAAARAAGGYVKEGQVYERPAVLPAERIAAGKKTNVRFSGKDKAAARFAVIEADDLHPSHRNGSENPLHFLPEAQPKDRSAEASKDSESSIRQIADAPDIEQLGVSNNAYSGAPVVNSRGEVVQGNNRSEGVRRHYETAEDGGEKLRADTAALAAEVGISPEEVGRFRNPVVVRVLESTDAESVRLGNFDVKDTESGGEQRVDPKATANRMDEATRSRLTQILGEGTDSVQTLSGVIKARSSQLVDLLTRKGLLSKTQRATILDAAGNLNADGVKAMRGVLRELVLGAGNKRLGSFYTRLPDTVRGGIDRALLHIAGGNGEADFRGELRTVISAMRERAAYIKKTGGTAKDWLTHAELFGDRQQTPAERLSPTEKALLNLFDRNSKKTGSAREVYEGLRRFAEATQGRPGDMFNAEIPGVAKEEALGYLAKAKSEKAARVPSKDAVQQRAELTSQVEAQRTTLRERADALEDERQQTGGKPFTSLPAELVQHYADLGALLLREKAMSLRQFTARLRQEHEAAGLTNTLTSREIKRTYNQAVRKLEGALGEKAKFTRARLTSEMSDLRADLRELGRKSLSEATAAARQKSATAAARAVARGNMLIERQRTSERLAHTRARAQAYQEAVKAQKKAVADWLAANRSRFAGHVRGKEMASILRRVNAATTTEAVDKALAYAENVLVKKEYAAQVAAAEKLRRQVKKSSTTAATNRQVTAADRPLLADFAKIDPNEVADLDGYLRRAAALVQGTKAASTTVDASGQRVAKPGRTYDNASVRTYVDGELARMETQRQQDLLDRFAHLTDASGAPLLQGAASADEMAALVAEAMRLSPDELQQAKDGAEALAKEKRAALDTAALDLQDKVLAGGQLAGLPAEVADALRSAVPADLSDKSVARLIGVLDNVRLNGNADGAGDVVAEVQAVRVAQELPAEMAKLGLIPSDISAMLKGDVSALSAAGRKLVNARVAAKKIKGGAIKGAISLDLVVELIAGNTKQAARVQRRVGISALSEGYTRATKGQETLMRGVSDLFQSFGKVGEKRARTALNVYRRGVLAHAMQHLGGSEAERRAHFERVKGEVRQTYERYLASPGLVNKQTGSLIKQAYDELLDAAATGDEAYAKMLGLGEEGARNSQVVRYFQEAFAANVDALDNNLRLYHNQALERFENYTATSKVMLDKSGLASAGEEAAADMTDSAFQPRAVGTKQSGTTLVRKGGLRKGQVLDLDFDNVQSRKYFEANYDIQTNGARRLFNSALRRGELVQAFGGEENAGVLYDRVKGQVDAQRGIGAAGNEAVSTGLRLFDVIARKGTRLALLGVTQLPKQYVSVAVNTLGTLGKNFNLYFKAAGLVHGSESKVLDDFLAQYPIALRAQTEAGLNRDVSYDRVKRVDVLGTEEGSLRKIGGAVAGVFEKAAEVAAKPLVYSDVTVAKTSWVAFYLESLKDAGVDVAGVGAADLGTVGTPAQRADAASYAEQKVSRAQNVNDKTKAAPLWQEAGNSWSKVGRSLVLPFSQFSVNQRARMMIDVSRAVQGGANAEGSKVALAATTAEMLTFNAMKAAVLAPLLAAGANAVIGALGLEPDKENEKAMTPLEKTLGYTFQDMFFSGMGSVVQSGGSALANEAYARMQDVPAGERPRQLVPELPSNPNQRDFSNLGVYGVLAQKLYMMQQAAPYLDGKADKILNARTQDTEEVELSEAEKRTIWATMLLDAVMLAGASDADLSRMTDKVQRKALKDMSEKYGMEKWQKRRIAGKGEVSAEREAAAADNRVALRAQAENNVKLTRLAEAVVAAAERGPAETEAKKKIVELAGGDKREVHRLRVALHNHIAAAKRFKDAPAYVREAGSLSTKKELGFYVRHLLEGKSESEQEEIKSELKKRRLLPSVVKEMLSEK